MLKKWVLIIVAGDVVLSGCSSRARNFAPVLAAAPTDEAAYASQLQTCRERLAARMDRSGRLASAAGGTAIGLGAGYAAGTATAAGTAGSMGAAAGAAAAAAVMVLPVAAVAGAWGISKIKKTKKERAIKTALAECLREGGYSVQEWRVMSKREVHAIAAASPEGNLRRADAAPAVNTPLTEAPSPKPR